MAPNRGAAYLTDKWKTLAADWVIVMAERQERLWMIATISAIIKSLETFGQRSDLHILTLPPKPKKKHSMQPPCGGEFVMMMMMMMQGDDLAQVHHQQEEDPNTILLSHKFSNM